MKTHYIKGSQLHAWYVYLFEKQMDGNRQCPCYECNKPLSEDIYKNVSITYSHLLEKKRYPHLAGVAENIAIVCADCHNLYTMHPKKAIKQYTKAQELKNKYNNESN